ncbi:1-aminocyclopropane-1-carboxylate deaminase/D-cysteine desulfhydrase [Methylocystis parvus]|uniref:1-aminocyclopropane-1-carboxylate deaminase/D-cysteine desulfhydrase n=1 Tax=Methylocystis parvus TaxID=134 RepID=UPI003C765652
MTGWGERLDALPRLSLIDQPTPLHAAPNLSAALGGPGIWFKRDDLIPAAFGGNKVRALDLIVADAVRQGADTLVTGAGILSNHVRATSALATRQGLSCVGVYWGAPPPRAEGNHRLARLLGAAIRFTHDDDRASVDAGIERVASDIRASGGNPYVIPRGGACPLAVLAHARAVRETLAQCAALGVSPTCVVMAVGGSATLAGWLLGGALFSAPWRIEAFTVSRPASEAAARARRLATDAAALIGAPFALGEGAFRVHDGFIGRGYGVPSREGRQAIEATARAEAIFLDPIYTGKAMAGYCALCARGEYADVQDVLFLHTGGAPALFTSCGEEA